MFDASDSKDAEAAESLFAEKGMGAPLSRPPDLQTLVVPKAPPRATETETGSVILVLASDRFNARVYRDLLDQRAYKSVIEQNYHRWPNALSLCTPHVILIDLSYPGHPSIEVAWRLMGDPAFRAIPTLAITDQPDRQSLSDTLTIIDNCDGRIAKPVSVSGFFPPIERLLDRARTG